jgi:Transglycosylase SLT domain
MRRSAILDNGWVSVVSHATIARPALRPTRIRGRRARRSASRPLRRAFQAMRVAPLAVQIIVGTVLVVIAWAAVNWIVQVVRKPTEVFAVSGSLAKVPVQTWRQYGPIFDENSTAVITPELLAALAQVESSGDPVARTYWRWRFSWNPFELYRPASSAVGMFQITDGTFAEARRYCIHDHVVIEDGPWHDLHSCWFNALYTRVVADHAVEMTAALLDRTVASILARNRMTTASLQQRQNLAAIIHLCGDGAGDEYARRAFRFRVGQRCGDHDPRRYLAQVNALKHQFARLRLADVHIRSDRKNLIA